MLTISQLLVHSITFPYTKIGNRRLSNEQMKSSWCSWCRSWLLTVLYCYYGHFFI